jgi:hypothetical protein
MVILQIILVFTLTPTCPKTFIQGHVSVFDKYLHLPHVSVYIYIYIHCNKISVSVNDLHVIYMVKLTLTRTTLV